jgi:hypothetical protein
MTDIKDSKNEAKQETVKVEEKKTDNAVKAENKDSK